MLASVYSYHVMVKSVSSCCVRGRRVLSNPVTYVANYCLIVTTLCSWMIHMLSEMHDPIIILENRPSYHIRHFEKYQVKVLKPPLMLDCSHTRFTV